MISFVVPAHNEEACLRRSWAVKLSNGLTLLIFLAVLTGPFWGFIPKSLTPLSSPIGKVRLVLGTFLCHVGLVLWPITLLLLINLFRQKRRTGWIQSLLLISFYSWQTWGATRGVIWFWPWLYHEVRTFLPG